MFFSSLVGVLVTEGLKGKIILTSTFKKKKSKRKNTSISTASLALDFMSWQNR